MSLLTYSTCRNICTNDMHKPCAFSWARLQVARYLITHQASSHALSAQAQEQMLPSSYSSFALLGACNCLACAAMAAAAGGGGWAKGLEGEEGARQEGGGGGGDSGLSCCCFCCCCCCCCCCWPLSHVTGSKQCLQHNRTTQCPACRIQTIDLSGKCTCANPSSNIPHTHTCYW
jgi:hypothetical protein